MSYQSRKLRRALSVTNGQCVTCRTAVRWWIVVQMQPTCPVCGSHDYETRGTSS